MSHEQWETGQIRVGTAPVNWNNPDLPDWRPAVPVTVMVAEMAAAGYAGTEYGARFPTEVKELTALLCRHNLALAGSYYWLDFPDDRRFRDDLAAMEARLPLLRDAGGKDVIVATRMTPERVALAGHVPAEGAWLDEAGWRNLEANLRTTVEVVWRYWLATHLHPHVGTWLETPAEVERLLTFQEATGTDLCFDSGHYAYGGGDPTEFVRDHAGQIGYLHLKDVDPIVLEEARDQEWSFLEALRHYIFCEFGQGMVDVPAVIDTLRSVDYRGWVVVEQDTTARSSLASARASRDYLRRECDL